MIKTVQIKPDNRELSIEVLIGHRHHGDYKLVLRASDAKTILWERSGTSNDFLADNHLISINTANLDQTFLSCACAVYRANHRQGQIYEVAYILRLAGQLVPEGLITEKGALDHDRVVACQFNLTHK